MFKRIATVICCALLITALPAKADQWNKKTKMTFNVPVELPGKVLPAGTYVFKLADSMSDRHVVQVFNEDETQIYATILAIPNYRLEPKGETTVHFSERAPGAAQAIRAWFYPGDNFGQEFVYPKVRATELAVETHEKVLAAEVTPTETPKELEQTPVVAVTPERHEVEMTEEVLTKPVESIAPAPAPAPEPAAPAEELPETASPIPLLGLIGFGSLFTAGALRILRKRS